jgi:hypothetical protein
MVVQERPSSETTELLSMAATSDEAMAHRGGSVSRWKILAVPCLVSLLLVSVVVVTMHRDTEAVAARDSQPETTFVELEGSSEKKKKDKNKGKNKSALACEDGKYSKRTLQLAYELPFASLFRDNQGQRKYEASSVVLVDGNAYAVCDSSWAISKFGSQLTPFAEGNVQIGDVDREDEDSGYEALFYESGTFYVVRESVQHGDKTYHAIIEELEMGPEDYTVTDACSTEFEFEGDSKGFEGAIALRDMNNELVVLGLCEGNHCSEERKNEVGNGRLVAMVKREKKKEDGTTSCEWKTLRAVHVPSSAYFRDYSAITMSPSGKVGITSQEDSQFWIGQLLGQQPDGRWDIGAITFDEDVGTVLDFPKDHSCETIYCNIEGVHWINDDMIIAVSDKMKGRGKQDFRCFDKDQSVHVFVLPG